ncbi:MAG: PEP-CTERM sorting domain-containing protein [Caulobacterales bacterium]|nr:PEP-CTERM sorting domain-containing protein [Caulobacterales bacterium]
MRKAIAAAALAVGLLSAAGAHAASLFFNFSDADSSIAVLSNGTLCLGNCTLTAALASPLPTNLEIAEGDEATFDFGKFHVKGGFGFGNAVLDAVLAFTTPSPDSGSTLGSAHYVRAGTARHPGVLGGTLTWDDPVQTFFTAKGSQFTITFNGLGGFTPGGDATSTVTVHVDSVAVPEPAAWAMMITGFGLAGAILRRRLALGV